MCFLSHWNFNFRNIRYNHNPYEAFNNSPIQFVDLNGKKPKSAAQILESEFGEERRPIYEAFDENMMAETATLQVEDNFLAALVDLEWRVDDLLEQHLPKDSPKPLKKLLKSVYRQPRRQIFKIGSGTYQYKVDYKPTTLTEATAHFYWEHNNIGRSIYEQEVSMWNQLNERLSKSRELMRGDCNYDLRADLSREELSTLYENDSYLYSNNLRARINCILPNVESNEYRTMYNTAHSYYKMNRGQFLNFNRSDGMLTPFQPLIVAP